MTSYPLRSVSAGYSSSGTQELEKAWSAMISSKAGRTRGVLTASVEGGVLASCVEKASGAASSFGVFMGGEQQAKSSGTSSDTAIRIKIFFFHRAAPYVLRELYWR